MKSDPRQSDIVGLVWFTGPPRAHGLTPGDVIKFDRRLCRVIRVNDCAAVVLMNRPVKQFKTRFDRAVRFQPPPAVFRISSQSEVEVLNPHKQKPKHKKTV